MELIENKIRIANVRKDIMIVMDLQKIVSNVINSVKLGNIDNILKYINT